MATKQICSHGKCMNKCVCCHGNCMNKCVCCYDKCMNKSVCFHSKCMNKSVCCQGKCINKSYVVMVNLLLTLWHSNWCNEPKIYHADHCYLETMLKCNINLTDVKEHIKMKTI